MKNSKIVNEMSLNQKARIVNGNGSWYTVGFDLPFVPSVKMNDGPHGLRVQEQEQVEHINDSNVATCFPTACASSCSWNTNALNQIGKAIGEEALHEKVSMVLGPGTNIKRSPLCGRNFEYFSEDPFLAGRLASAFIDGVQSKNVGTSLKHFAVNSQEKRRMSIDTIIDQRALREIYLSAFEYAVKNSQPTSIMAAYNKVNGSYCTENKQLLTDILRNEWGFKGIVVSDWGATNDVVNCIKNGLDLEMPDSLGHNTSKIVKAVENKELSMEQLDRAVGNVVDFAVERAKYVGDYDVDYATHHNTAKVVETESAVLLKNENILPLKPNQKVLVVGEMAVKMRFQGAGSSHINTAPTPNLIDAMKVNNIKVDYVRGYDIVGDKVETTLEDQAVTLASKYDVVVFCGGLTDSFEGEGYDRDTLDMPHCQNQLISKLVKVNPNVVVVAFGGSPMLMPWVDQVKGLLHMYLGGQGVGEAAYELLYGIVNPSGKLAETYPLRLDDTPCYNYFATGMRSVEHRESIFVGYRYYDTFNVPTLFDFGYGLSYTKFEYSDLVVNKNNVHNYTVTLKVKNVGQRAGKEVVQLYIVNPTTNVINVKRELKGFAKTKLLEPNEIETIEFRLDKRSFAHFDAESNDYVVMQGNYCIEISASLHDVKLSNSVNVEGVTLPSQRELTDYFEQNGNTFKVSDEQFSKLAQISLIEEKPFVRGEFTLNSTLEQMAGVSSVARMVIRFSDKIALKMSNGDSSSPVYKMTSFGTRETPLHTIPTMTQNMLKLKHCRAIVAFANGKFFKGIGYLMGKDK